MTGSSQGSRLTGASSEWMFYKAALVGMGLLCAMPSARAGAASFAYTGQITSNNGTNLPLGTVFHGVIELDPMANIARANPGSIFDPAILSWELRDSSDELVGRATAGTVQVEDDLTVQPSRENPNPMPTQGTDFIYLSTFRALHDPALTVESRRGETWKLYRMDLQFIDTTGMALENEDFPSESLLSQQFLTRRFSLSFRNDVSGAGLTLSGTLLSLTSLPIPEPAAAELIVLAGAIAACYAGIKWRPPADE